MRYALILITIFCFYTFFSRNIFAQSCCEGPTQSCLPGDVCYYNGMSGGVRCGNCGPPPVVSDTCSANNCGGTCGCGTCRAPFNPQNGTACACRGCNNTTPVNGACTPTHYNCSSGTLGATAEYADSWQWWCNGSGGGASVLCSEMKPTCASAGPSGNPSVSASINSYNVYAYSVTNATSVTFWVWSNINGQDDLIGYPGTNLGGGTWYANINPAVNPVYLGQFQVDVWMNGWTSFCGGAPFIRNSPPAFSSLSLTNSSGTTVAWDTGSKAHICKSGFQSDPQPRRVTFNFVLSDADGGSDIKMAQMRWNGTITNLTLGVASGTTVPATATIDYTGINVGSTAPIYVNISDVGVTTGFMITPYTWKVWNCQVPVSGTIFDGSAGQACNNIGFSLSAPSSMNFSALTFRDMSGGSNVVASVAPPSSFGTNNLVWGQSYLPLVNNGDIVNPDGNIVGSGRFTRLIDTGVGTTICPSNAEFNTTTDVSAYSANPGLTVDLSYIKDQEGWFQGKGLDIRSKNGISSGVPITASSFLSVDNLNIGTSNNGVVAGPSYRNTNGWNDSSQYGSPNNWYVSQSFVDPHKFDYPDLFDTYYQRLGEGVTGVTTIATGDTGVKFVNGDLNIDSDVVVANNQYLMVIVSGSINIGVGASRVDGIYVADGGINALGTSDNQLIINGILYASGRNSNIRLARSFTVKSNNNLTPAVVVNYQPEMVFALPGRLFKVLTGWREN